VTGVIRALLVHWNEEERDARASLLRDAGLDVRFRPSDGSGILQLIRSDPPDLVVIDLTRLPSHGREIAVTLRTRKATRAIPLVFVEGDPAKVRRIRELLPDATFATWRGIRGAVKRALTRRSAEPIAMPSVFEAYAGRPLAAKLGVKPGTVLALIGAPGDFEATLGSLPAGARVQRRPTAEATLVVWFVGTRRALEGELPRVVARHGHVPIWIAWRKQAARAGGDLTQPYVRATGLAHGLVDYKVCAIDATWSGLLFRRRA
jgi:CheY-like chemotaxis protein